MVILVVWPETWISVLFVSISRLIPGSCGFASRIFPILQGCALWRLFPSLAVHLSAYISDSCSYLRIFINELPVYVVFFPVSLVGYKHKGFFESLLYFVYLLFGVHKIDNMTVQGV